MAILYFRVSSDYDEVIRLRQECEKLEAQLKKMDVNKSPAAARALETQLASTRQQMMSLVTEAGRVGAVMENDLKNKLNSASKASDELTEEIIKQRKIIRDTQDDVRRLSDEYSKMGRYSPNSKAKLAELNRAKAALNEQRYAMGELQDQQLEGEDQGDMGYRVLPVHEYDDHDCEEFQCEEGYHDEEADHPLILQQ